MKDILKYYAKILTAYTLTLKKTEILIDKPWALIDDDGQLQKLIFRRNNRLILSKNGAVIEGTWEYIPEAKALLINRGADKILLKEQFIDDNVLIMKKDGTENDFYALANENTIIDYNVPQYLNSLRCKNLFIKEVKLTSGLKLSVHNGYSYLDIQNDVEFLDDDFNPRNVPDGIYVTENKNRTLYIKNSKIELVKENAVEILEHGETIEIPEGYEHAPVYNINKKITVNGKPVLNGKFKTSGNHIYEIRESTIVNVVFHNSYNLKNGFKIVIEQKSNSRINKGDIILECEPISSIPDGIYGIKGKWFKKIKVSDSIVI